MKLTFLQKFRASLPHIKALMDIWLGKEKPHDRPKPPTPIDLPDDPADRL